MECLLHNTHLLLTLWVYDVRTYQKLTFTRMSTTLGCWRRVAWYSLGGFPLPIRRANPTPENLPSLYISGPDINCCSLQYVHHLNISPWRCEMPLNRRLSSSVLGEGGVDFAWIVLSRDEDEVAQVDVMKKMIEGSPIGVLHHPADAMNASYTNMHHT